jgi:LTXXQ motif family protein
MGLPRINAVATPVLVAETEFSCARTRKERMNSNAIVALLLCIVTSSQPAFTGVQHQPTDGEPPHVTIARSSADYAHVSAALLATTPIISRSPRDLPGDYELEMASIAAQLSMERAVNSNAVRTGQIPREQEKYIIGEGYQAANDAISALWCIALDARGGYRPNAAVPTDPTPSSSDDLVLVAMPFSSLQLSPSLIEYLGLTPTQVRSIQRLMDGERPKTEPLMHELRTISGEMRVAIQRSHNNENEGTPKRLAARQARLLKELMKANSRLQRMINDVLDPQQRKKLDSFKRMSEVTVVDGD